MRLANKQIRAVHVRTVHFPGYDIIREKLGWSLDASAEKSKARKLMKRAVVTNGNLDAKRNRNSLTPFFDAMRKATWNSRR